MAAEKTKTKRGRPTGSKAGVDIKLGAMQAFAQYGFNNCTVAHILEASGCSRTNFYRFFKSKEEVFVRLVFASLKSLEEKLTASVTNNQELATFEAQLEYFFQVYYDYCFSFGDLVPVMFEAEKSHPEHRHICDGIRSAQIKLIAQLLRSNGKSVPELLLMEALVAGSERIINGLSAQKSSAQDKAKKAVSLSMAMYTPVLVSC